jgi:acid phosphatase
MVPDSPRHERPGIRVWTALVTMLLAGCANAPPHEMLNAVLWQQRAAEFRALALQSYATATARLEEALATPSWSAALEQQPGAASLPPAVILDLDETVIDNGRYEARIVRRLGQYSPESFAAWCEESTAGAIPGAIEFLAAARARGVAVFFYTAREEALRECTARTLRAIGAGPVAQQSLFLRGAGDKAQIRARVAMTHRIVLLVGDNLEDFVAGSKTDEAARRAIADRHAQWFGRRWIMLPNAVYGHWEALYYGYDQRMPRSARLGRKQAVLDE